MGWAHISSLYNPHDTIEERVENNGKEATVTKGLSMTYAQAVNCKNSVEDQNQKILENEPLATH